MNKNDFFFFNAVSGRDNEYEPFPATVKKECIAAVIKMKNGKGCIFCNDTYIYTEDSYEDILIQLFNQ